MKKKFLVIAAVLSIFLFATAIRSFSFFLQHWQGDQSQYVALAMKYDSYGMEGLNLDGLEIRKIVYVEYPDWQFMFPAFSKDPNHSDFYKAYGQFGLEIYEGPLFYKAPLLPAALSQSHRLFAKPGQPFVVLKTNMGEGIKPIEWSRHFFTAQFWAVIVPVASSLLVILLTFFFARKLFDTRSAIYAMLLMAIHPVGIVTASKILADDFVSFFVIASLFLFFIAVEKQAALLALFAGFLAGFGFLAKQSALLLIPIVTLYLLFASSGKWYHPKTWIAMFKNKILWLYLAGSIFISAHWFYKVYQVYGSPFYEPDFARIFEEAKGGWYMLVGTRPHALYLFIVNVPLLCPPFFWGHLSFRDFLKALFSEKLPVSQRNTLLFLWFWILAFLGFFMMHGAGSKEERYLLPVYPALAMLSGYGLSAFQERFARHFSKPALAQTLALILLFATVAWSVPIGLETVFAERFLILEPVKLAQIFYKSFFRIIGVVA